MAQKKTFAQSLKSLFAALVMVFALGIAFLIYFFVLGDPSHFEGNDPNNHPVKGDLLGIVYKGGIIVPFLISIFIIIITFSIERMITIGRAKGRGLSTFIPRVQEHIRQDNIQAAIADCKANKSSLANVLLGGLKKYEEVKSDDSLTGEQKVMMVQKELEEGTSFELPMLSKNLVIISTLASVATLVGLVGTVVGMIKAFSAIATAGAPDAIQLANGISEALINTFLGISGSVIAIIMYNYFSSMIDALTYKIDEASYSLVQTISAKHKVVGIH